MKKALVCAMILGQFAAEGRDLAPARAQRSVVCSSSRVAVLSQSKAASIDRYPAPVAEMTTGNGPTVEGVFLRAATAPRPLQMLNPLAPPLYGSAGNLVTYTDDPNRTSNPNKRAPFQADGIRLFTLRSLW